VNANILTVRNLTEAVPELLRLMVREGRARGEDELAVERPVAVRYMRPFEGIVAWPQWPDAPLELFWSGLRNAAHMPITYETRGEDADLEGPYTFFVRFEEHDLLAAVGDIPTCTSLAMQICTAWRRTPVNGLQITYNGLTCTRDLLDAVGELLLEVGPYPELGGKIDPIDERAAEELAAFIPPARGDPDVSGPRRGTGQQ
jgi:hypothetical protein